MAGLATQSGRKFYTTALAHTPVTDTPAEFAALTWVQVKGVGSFGEIGTKTNILNYDTWDDDVIQKQKGQSDAGTPDVELRRIAADPGQLLLRTNAGTKLEYPFKIEGNDPLTSGGTPTIIYLAGVVAGPTRPQGRNEDFDLEVFSLGINYKEIVVAPT